MKILVVNNAAPFVRGGAEEHLGRKIPGCGLQLKLVW